MTFHELRRAIDGMGYVPIKWNKSEIVELAGVTETGAIQITNVMTNKSYKIPRNMTDLDITILDRSAYVRAGQLLPKGVKV